MKKKTFTLIAVSALLGLAALTFNVGCASSGDGSESTSPALSVAKVAAQALLLTSVDSLVSGGPEQAALRALINGAFSAASAPDAVAQALRAGVAEMYTDDASAGEIVLLTMLDALLAPPVDGVPAAGPTDSYQTELAEALASPTAMLEWRQDLQDLYYAPGELSAESVDVLALLDSGSNSTPAWAAATDGMTDVQVDDYRAHLVAQASAY